ncbi:DUF4783 domain-containing protein [Flectobacillus major]|jgi:hypothetical protein|uniref:DUF4783 domain-containing protein n=1 Tax=Flectobacillus major TaxID=103 RepID=UPI000693627C|nr:DUF4783 domain-containing protein [Flectobacillus major]
MKLLLSVLLTLILWAQKVEYDPQSLLVGKLLTSLKQGHASELASMFNENVDLLIDTEQIDFSEISQTHAELILKSFFKRWPPQDFQLVHQGANSLSQYYTGVYKTNRGNYSVYILLKRNQDKFLVESIQFRKEK